MLSLRHLWDIHVYNLVYPAQGQETGEGPNKRGCDAVVSAERVAAQKPGKVFPEVGSDQLDPMLRD